MFNTSKNKKKTCRVFSQVSDGFRICQTFLLKKSDSSGHVALNPKISKLLKHRSKAVKTLSHTKPGQS